MPATIRTPSLNALLALDAATCAAMGALLTLASGPLAELTSIPEAVVFRAGALLLPVAAFMAFGARVWPVPGWMAGAAIAGNALWAAASVLLPASGLIAPNAIGWAFLLAQAVAVALLAALELEATRSRRAVAA